MSSSNIAVIYYSATGSVHRLARAVAEGAADAGAEVRLRRVAELAPDYAIDTSPAWQAHLEETKDTVEEAALDDLDWADGFAFGAPTRYGNVCAQLKQFLDQTGPLWMAGKLFPAGPSIDLPAWSLPAGRDESDYNQYVPTVRGGYVCPDQPNPVGASRLSTTWEGAAPCRRTSRLRRSFTRSCWRTAGSSRPRRCSRSLR